VNPFDDLQDAGIFLIVVGILFVGIDFFTYGLCCFLGLPMLFVGVILVVVQAFQPRQPRYWPPGPGGYGLPQYQQPVMRTPFCPNCGRPSQYVAPYQRFYCETCRAYLPEHLQPPRR
jgi:hypothetical protein